MNNFQKNLENFRKPSNFTDYCQKFIPSMTAFFWLRIQFIIYNKSFELKEIKFHGLQIPVNLCEKEAVKPIITCSDSLSIEKTENYHFNSFYSGTYKSSGYIESYPSWYKENFPAGNVRDLNLKISNEKFR